MVAALRRFEAAHLSKDHHTWSAELRFHGDRVGWEAQVLKDGDLVIARTWILHGPAVARADEQKRDVERSWIDE